MHMTKMVAGSLLMGWMALTVVAEDAKPDGDVEVTKLEAESVKRAKFVDFAGELEVSLSALEDLGEQIDSARLTSNPVQLAMASKLLEAAEAVSGKKASLTAEDVMKEAVMLAEVRSNSTELATIAKLAGGKLGNKLEVAAKAIQEKQVNADENTKDLDGDLIVDNRQNHDEVHVYVNGYEVGHVPGHGYRSFHVHGAHYVTAKDHYGHRWHRHIHGHQHYYRFYLHPPHHHH